MPFTKFNAVKQIRGVFVIPVTQNITFLISEPFLLLLTTVEFLHECDDQWLENEELMNSWFWGRYHVFSSQNVKVQVK